MKIIKDSPTLLSTEVKINSLIHSLKLIQGDITAEATDIIVNAANDQLILGAGVAGAIRRNAGPSVQEECNRIGHTPVGQVAITSAGNLAAKFIFHAVGPQYHHYKPPTADKLLKSTITESLRKMEAVKAQSITFPAISCGIFGFPVDRAASIIYEGIFDSLPSFTTPKLIQICLFSPNVFQIFANELKAHLN